jgi:hypothetical protein
MGTRTIRRARGLHVTLSLPYAAKLALGALVCLLPSCVAERSGSSPTSGDASASSPQVPRADSGAHFDADAASGHAANSEPMELHTGGTAALTQADFKFPFYPGASVDAERCQRLNMGGAYSNTVVHTTTDSLKRVAAFYRKKLRESAQGKAIVESSESNKVTLVAKRAEKDITMVVVERVPELDIVEITQQQLGEAAVR